MQPRIWSCTSPIFPKQPLFMLLSWAFTQYPQPFGLVLTPELVPNSNLAAVAGKEGGNSLVKQREREGTEHPRAMDGKEKWAGLGTVSKSRLPIMPTPSLCTSAYSKVGNYHGSRPQLCSGEWLEGGKLGRYHCLAWEVQETGMFSIGRKPRDWACSCSGNMCCFSEAKSLHLTQGRDAMMARSPALALDQGILCHSCLLGQVYRADIQMCKRKRAKQEAERITTQVKILSLEVVYVCQLFSGSYIIKGLFCDLWQRVSLTRAHMWAFREMAAWMCFIAFWNGIFCPEPILEHQKNHQMLKAQRRLKRTEEVIPQTGIISLAINACRIIHDYKA